MFDPRDFSANPYSGDEIRIVEYLQSVAPDIGAGDDPIGFLIAAHHYLMRERRAQRQACKSPAHPPNAKEG